MTFAIKSMSLVLKTMSFVLKTVSFALKTMVLAGLFFLLLACSKQDASQPLIVVENAHMRPLPPNSYTGAVYLTLRNTSDKVQTVTYVHSPVADRVEVHRSFYEDGMMRMREVNHLRLDIGQTQYFKAGGYHLMVIGFESTMRAGDQFPLIIEFDTGLSVEIPVDVRL